MTTSPHPGTARSSTGWSVAGLLLLVPTFVVAWLLVLSTERGSKCLTDGEGCSSVPYEDVYGCFFAALAAGALALLWPRTRWVVVRSGVVMLQWGAQLTMGALILTGA
ncbi:hypothetical protein ACIPJS_13910 [Streptomyces sp. NPDC086783]|uniref:hypothetical protein n=1 Tax=Streptomyces sp. NPDC086783 TaxID=3365758 RepID=UPI0038219010